MASGDTLFILTPHSADLPSSGDVPSPDSRNDHPVLNFDAAVDGVLNFPIVMPRHYAGLGTTSTVYWSGATAESGVTVWSLAWERHADDAFDLDADGFATAVTVDATVAGTTGELSYDTIAHTDGAQMDSIAVGESGRLQLQRLGSSDADDTMAGDAQMHRIEIRET